MVRMTILALAGLMGILPIQTASSQITIDPSKSQPISPYIYGVNYPDNWIYDWLQEWRHYHQGFTLARLGGNRFTAYNWETNASNAGHDYFFENDDYLALNPEPGWPVSRFLNFVQSTGAAALITVPTLGYVSADKDTNRDGGKDVNHTKDWLTTRFVKSVASKPGKHYTYPPDLSDAAVYQDEFVHWVQSIKSSKTPVWFSLDNEPDFWHSTHLRINPVAPGYADIIRNNLEYAAAIKSVAPDSLVFGPVNYGWQGMRQFQGAPDAKGRIFVDTYLDEVGKMSAKVGKRLVDVYDFHWYPEAKGDGARIIYSPGAGKPGTQAARIQAPRSLWDSTFIEDSWITQSLGNKPIRLLPDMQERVDKHYPGTKLAITEYEFGGRQSISGALAQADALGVFGRYGLFAACHWGINHTESPVMAAFYAFTNYDRSGSTFGDRGLHVEGENPALNSVYASLDSRDPNRMVLVVINKTSQAQEFSLNLKSFNPRYERGFVVRDGVYARPESADVTIKKNVVDYRSPALSICTIELVR